MTYSEVAAGLSCVSTIGVGFLAYLNLKIKSDMSKLKLDILQGINGKYFTRAEVVQRDIMLEAKEKSTNKAIEKLTEIAEAMAKAGAELKLDFVKLESEHQLHFHKRKTDG